MDCNPPSVSLFQSPLGEVVKETLQCWGVWVSPTKVSIPSRGSGKGDITGSEGDYLIVFQSPLGEVVKETHPRLRSYRVRTKSFNPLSGKW